MRGWLTGYARWLCSKARAFSNFAHLLLGCCSNPSPAPCPLFGPSRPLICLLLSKLLRSLFVVESCTRVGCLRSFEDKRTSSLCFSKSSAWRGPRPLHLLALQIIRYKVYSSLLKWLQECWADTCRDSQPASQALLFFADSTLARCLTQFLDLCNAKL